jgi:phosphatidylglycerol:prolipoprotein diacylglycerol transferase
MPLAIQFPTWLKPEIIPGLPIRWYGLMYVVAFVVTWLLFRWEARRRNAPLNDDDIFAWFFWAIIGLIAGARIFGCLLYDPTGMYREKPWLVLWPFSEGRYIGFQGMSYHGGLVGMIVATLIYCRSRRSDWFLWADIAAVCAPLGYTAGRLGNFINGELWGKVTEAPWGMIFPSVPVESWFDPSESWVQDAARKLGMSLSPGIPVNLPRHPSQLYEAIFEGLVLWLVLWFFVRKRKSFPGFASSIYAIGYGLIRFVIEYFRDPDFGIGYVIKLGDPNAPTNRFGGLLNFSMGQLLCACMIVGGALMMYFCLRTYNKSKDGKNLSESRLGSATSVPQPSHNSLARRIRKKIR